MRLISLASGTLPEFDPVTVVESAAAAGFQGCGVWFGPESWSDETARAVRAAFQRTGLTPLEMEVMMIGDPQRSADSLALLDAGAAVGVTEAIVVSREQDVSRNVDLLGGLAEDAADRGIHLCLEFLPIFAISDFSSARDVLARVDHENLKLLVDPLHMARTNLDPVLLAAESPTLFSFAQFCDAPAQPPGDGGFEALYDEALNGRLLPGEGELPLRQLLEALPSGIPLSLELRARWLRERFPDPVQRARAVFESTTSWLSDGGSPG